MSSRFHLAVAVPDLDEARRFYGGVLGFPEGRATEHWIDWDCYGNQLVTHLGIPAAEFAESVVDGTGVPVPHFGVLLTHEEFHQLVDRAKRGGARFEIEPTLRYRGQVGEQWTAFFWDFSGNALEFKSFKDDSQVFQQWEPAQ
ncbi:MAG: VOC family protein [Segniliparus sp.]|uniref:VOC family protein n=1 Tax=Segniliparus sp. TaxID=2804064 RepID=UPI003F4027FD